MIEVAQLQVSRELIVGRERGFSGFVANIFLEQKLLERAR